MTAPAPGLRLARQAARENAKHGPLYVEAWDGLGDTVYLRPFLRHLSESRDLYVRTSWPELFADLDVKLVRSPTSLRTQRKNIARQDGTVWSPLPQAGERLKIRLSWNSSVPEGIAESLRLNIQPEYDLPDMGPCPVKANRPIAMIRPCVLRAEWRNDARNPDPKYIAQAAAMLRDAGYYVVSVADLYGTAEWLEEPAPPADLVLHHGELDTRALLALATHAAVVVGGVGWIVPVGLCTRTPTLVIGGGNGRHNAPRYIVPPWGEHRIRFLLPRPYCMCSSMTHKCNREIPDFEAQFKAALREVTNG